VVRHRKTWTIDLSGVRVGLSPLNFVDFFKWTGPCSNPNERKNPLKNKSTKTPTEKTGCVKGPTLSVANHALRLGVLCTDPISYGQIRGYTAAQGLISFRLPRAPACMWLLDGDFFRIEFLLGPGTGTGYPKDQGWGYIFYWLPPVRLAGFGATRSGGGNAFSSFFCPLGVCIFRSPPKDGEIALQTPRTKFWRYG